MGVEGGMVAYGFGTELFVPGCAMPWRALRYRPCCEFDHLKPCTKTLYGAFYRYPKP